MSFTVNQLLEQLCAAPGTSGQEDGIRETIRKLLQDNVPGSEITVDALGNISAFLGDRTAEHQFLIDAHIDQIGLTVTGITDEGFLRIAAVGGMDRRVLPTSPVTVYGRETLKGIVSFLPPHLTKDDSRYADIEDCAVDIGLSREEAETAVSPGDRIILQQPLLQLLGNRVTASALDDRAGCAAVLLCGNILSDQILDCGVTLSFTSREETGCDGARTAAYLTEPTEALIVDVTFADQPGVSPQECGKLGKGPMIGFSPSLSRQMSNDLKNTAESSEIPYQIEVMGGRTGTNADMIGISKEGVPCATVSIPLRNMHTPAEIVDTQDIVNTAELICSYITEGGASLG